MKRIQHISNPPNIKPQEAWIKKMCMHHNIVLLNSSHLQATLATGGIFPFPVLWPPEACWGLQFHSWIPATLSPQLQHCVDPAVQRQAEGSCFVDEIPKHKLSWHDSDPAQAQFAQPLQDFKITWRQSNTPPKCVFLPHRPGYAVLSFSNVARK